MEHGVLPPDIRKQQPKDTEGFEGMDKAARRADIEFNREKINKASEKTSKLQREEAQELKNKRMKNARRTMKEHDAFRGESVEERLAGDIALRQIGGDITDIDGILPHGAVETAAVNISLEALTKPMPEKELKRLIAGLDDKILEKRTEELFDVISHTYRQNGKFSKWDKNDPVILLLQKFRTKIKEREQKRIDAVRKNIETMGEQQEDNEKKPATVIAFPRDRRKTLEQRRKENAKADMDRLKEIRDTISERDRLMEALIQRGSNLSVAERAGIKDQFIALGKTAREQAKILPKSTENLVESRLALQQNIFSKATSMWSAVKRAFSPLGGATFTAQTGLAKYFDASIDRRLDEWADYLLGRKQNEDGLRADNQEEDEEEMEREAA